MANDFVNSYEVTALFESLRACRVLRSRPVRAGEWICRKKHCLSRAVEALGPNKRGHGAQGPKGRRPLAPSNGKCDACELPHKNGKMKRGTGANTQLMNWLFRDFHDRTRDKENRVDLSSSRIRSDCYRAWKIYVTGSKRSSTRTETALHTGPNALFVQQKIKEVYVQEAQAQAQAQAQAAHLDGSTPPTQTLTCG